MDWIDIGGWCGLAQCGILFGRHLRRMGHEVSSGVLEGNTNFTSLRTYLGWSLVSTDEVMNGILESV